MVDPRVQELWADLLGRWSEESAHAAFVEYCRASRQLDQAAKLYRAETQPATPYRDDLLGSLGGVFHGTVVDVNPGRHFLVADAYWVPPEGDPIGPMALEVYCEDDPGGCRLKVLQNGYEDAPRWRRYYAVVSRGWQLSLTALKRYAETRPGVRR